MFNQNIASLRVVLGADVSKFRRGMKRAQTTLKNTGKQMKAFAQKAGVSLPLAFTAAAAGLTALMAKTAKWGDTIAKSAKQAGVTTEFLSEMEFAAERAGASLSDVMNGIRRMARAASDANRGMVTYQRAFNELDIVVTDSHGNLKKTEVLFMEVVAALGEVENSTQRVALAQEIFGRGGMKLLPLLSEDISALRSLAKELGVSLSAEQAAGMEDFADSILNVKTALKGFAVEATSDKMSWAVITLERLVELMKEYNKGGLGEALKYAFGASQMQSMQMPGPPPTLRPPMAQPAGTSPLGTTTGWQGFNTPPGSAFVGPPSHFDRLPKDLIDSATKFTAAIEQGRINAELQEMVGNTKNLHHDLTTIDSDFEQIGETVIASADKIQEWSDSAAKAAGRVTEGVYMLFDALDADDFWASLYQNAKRYFQMLIAESIRSRSYAWFLGQFSGGNIAGVSGGGIIPTGNPNLGMSTAPMNVTLVNNSGMPMEASASMGAGGLEVILEPVIKKMFNGGRMDGTMKQFNAYRTV